MQTGRGRVAALLVGMVVAALLAAVAGNVGPAHGATVLPQGFTQTQVTSGLTASHDMEFAPDGRLFVAQQGGVVLIVNPDRTKSTFLDISSQVYHQNSMGLLGITLDPQFATNRFVYLFYTRKATDTDGDGVIDIPMHNRIVRVTANASGDSVVPGSEQLLLRMNDLVDNGMHNGGSMKFGADGKLYASVGDNNQRTPGQSMDTLLGKMVRINSDGTIPTDNPFYSTASGNNRAIWALGLRNPFKIAVQPGTGTLFVNDVGENAWEEINRGVSGANYGWNRFEGEANTPPYVDPVFAYPHDDAGTQAPNTTGCSVLGGTFYNPATAQFPAGYAGDYFFADFCNRWIRSYDPATDQASLFATDFGTAIDMEVSEDGSLYALKRGSVERIRFTGSANRAPSAAISASPTSGPLPLAVAFDGSGSSDPDSGDTLSYLWDFDGNGTVDETTPAPTTDHSYSTGGTYAASLRVRDNRGAVSDPATVRIDAGNRPPSPEVGSPSADLLFGVGQQIALSGSATDPEDGQLPASSFEWEVLQHHDGSHTHPYFSGTGNNLTITAPAPEGLASTGAGNYLEVRLTATDTEGVSKTVSRDVQPNRVNISFASNPSGLSLQADDHVFATPQSFATPKTIVSWEGYNLTVNAPSPQTLSGRTYAFSSWSDGKAQKHDIVTGATPSTYTATFDTATPAGCTKTGTSGNDVLDGTPDNDIICGGGGADTINGLGGNDILKGEGGADNLLGGAGDDTFDGGTGTDFAKFSGALAAVTASLTTNTATGEGSDTLTSIESVSGSSKNDALTGSNANNTINGGSGADTLDGLGGADKLTGAGGSDTERGGLGNDTVIGSGGPDNLFGEDGDDTVDSKDGVNGNDSLDGGSHVNGDTAITDATEKSIVAFP